MNNKSVWAFSIENKLRGARDQDRQVISYLEDLRKVNQENHHLVYLTINGKKPTSIEEDDYQKAEKEISLMSAQELCQWLASVEVKAPKIQFFVQQFQTFIQTEILSMNLASQQVNPLTEEIAKDSAYVKTALDIMNLQDELYQKLLDKLFEDLEDKFRSLENHENWKVTKETDKKPNAQYYQPIRFTSPCKNFYLAVEFNNPNFRGCFFTLSLVNTENEFIKEKLTTFLEKKYGKDRNQADKHWLYWKYFDGDVRDWTNETWARIPTGQLADEIWQELETLTTALVNLNPTP
ncbi:hypothetical protein A4G20_08410 [Pasteurellaceae bacterium RH1A]|nr:hypothetical protein A4G20_08410 [Pasteurellaceae bacterium RH1A]